MCQSKKQLARIKTQFESKLCRQLQLVKDSIKGLNESGLIEPIELDSSFGVQIDEDGQTIGIVIKIREYQDQ